MLSRSLTSYVGETPAAISVAERVHTPSDLGSFGWAASPEVATIDAELRSMIEAFGVKCAELRVAAR